MKSEDWKEWAEEVGQRSELLRRARQMRGGAEEFCSESTLGTVTVLTFLPGTMRKLRELSVKLSRHSAEQAPRQ